MIAHIFTWLFVFAVPWQDMVVLPGVGTMSKLLGIAAVGATALNVLLRARVRKLSTFHWLVFAYLCWVLLSTFWAVAQPASIQRKVQTYLQILAMVWVIWESTPTRARMHNLLQAYVLGAYVAALATVYNYLAGAGIEKTYNRFAAQGFDANDLGMLLALGLPMAWYLASAVPSGLQRWGNRGYFLVAILALLLTGSRGALVASLVALSVVPFTIGHLRTGVKVAGLVIIILAAVAAIRFVPEKSFERLSSTTTEISEGTLTGRLVIWQRGLALVPERPLHGYGPAGWFPSVGFIGLRIRSSHNTYLSILVEEGLIGLLLYLSMFAVVLRRLRALPSFERKVGTALMATLMTAILPLNWDVYKASWLVLALLAGWADVLARSHPAPVRAPTSRTPLRRPRVGPTPVTTR